MRPMKILMITENWAPRIGGIENYLSNIVTNLPSGASTVIAPIHENTKNTPGVIRKRFFWPLIKPAWLPLYLFLKSKIKEEKPDIILCGKTLFEGLLASWLKKKFNIPYVVFTYAMEIEVWAKTERKKLERVLQNADRVVYINEETKKSLIGFGVTDQQLVKIWPGVDDRFFNPISDSEKARIKEKYVLPEKYIFTLTRLIPRKGVDVLIEGYKNVNTDVQLVIAGTGPQEKALKELVQTLNLQDRVKFLGYVPDEDLPALYSGATVFALPPKKDPEDIEGFGIVYMEAAACGLPAIGTLVGGIPEAVVHNQTGILVQPDNPQAVTEAITAFLTDENKRKMLGDAAKKRAYDEFRWSKRILLVKGMIDAVVR